MDDDPEELLYNLGFGTQVSSPVDRIPSRFLHQSEVNGNDLNNFIVKQEEMWETNNMHLSGYHGLSGFPANGEPVHGIVGKIHEKIRQRNRELKNSKKTPSFFNAAYSVMAARAFRNLVRQPSVNPTSILEPQNRDFLERQTESVQRRRKRPRLVLGKNSFVLDTDEELVDEDECESLESNGSLEVRKRSVTHQVVDAEVQLRNSESGDNLKESDAKKEDGKAALVESERLLSNINDNVEKLEEKCDPEKANGHRWPAADERVNGSEFCSVAGETKSVERTMSTLRSAEKEFAEKTNEIICEHSLPVKRLADDIIKESTIVDVSHLIGDGSGSVNASSKVTVAVEQKVGNRLGVSKTNEAAVVEGCCSQSLDSWSVAKTEEKCRPMESVKIDPEDEAKKRWSERSDDQKRVGRVGQQQRAPQFQMGRGWIRRSDGGGWVRLEDKRGTSLGNALVVVKSDRDKTTISRTTSPVDSIVEMVMVTSNPPHSTSESPGETERRSHFKRQSGVDPCSIDSALSDLSSLTICKTEKNDHLTKLENDRNKDTKNCIRRPPPLCSRVESGFVSCDLEYRDEMDAAYSSDETLVAHSKSDESGFPVCNETKDVAAVPTELTSASSNGDVDEKVMNQSNRRMSLHQEFLEKIRHRCRMASSDGASIAVTTTNTSTTPMENSRSKVSVDGFSDQRFSNKPSLPQETCGDVSVDTSDQPMTTFADEMSRTSNLQDKSRLGEFHEGCVSAMDKMQKSMQLYVKRLRNMEQAWGETYNKWFLSSRKSEKRDLNQLANVHQSIMEEAQQTQALLLDHSRAIELAKQQSTCQAVDARLVVCSGQLQTVAQDLDGIIREQDSMLRHMREMEEDEETTTDSDPSTCGDTVVSVTSVEPINSAPPLPQVKLQPISIDPVVSSVSSATFSPPSSPDRTSLPTSTSTEGIHKLLNKLKQEMTADIKSTIGEDCVRFEKDLKSTGKQMEDVKSFLSRMLSVIQTNK